MVGKIFLKPPPFISLTKLQSKGKKRERKRKEGKKRKREKIRVCLFYTPCLREGA